MVFLYLFYCKLLVKNSSLCYKSKQWLLLSSVRVNESLN
ncbi:hypothetical protein SLEP1_g13671 [Rubroshorea leprosula]|uniref:Uncharacterized protein n=1 Tax=Rubroshorea leprosula TaxID=152421 RepID=A0AAV5IGP4_9ROSI|nr:hypothetical protein SLEP1_g13671 [Rubroshorea leprosula]